MRGVVLSLLVLSGALAAGCRQEPVAPMAIGEVRVHAGDIAAAGTGIDDTDWPRRHWSELSTRELTWLRARVSLPERMAGAGVPLGLYLVATAAAEVYWDGERLGAKGRPGASQASEVPGPLTEVFALPPRLSAPGEHTMAIRLSAHRAGARIATPIDGLWIGAYGSPLRYTRDQYLPSLIAGGALVLALAFLVLLWRRGVDPAAGWLALAATGALLQLGTETARAFVQYDYTWHAHRLAGIGVAAAITGAGMLGFAFRRFEVRRRPWPWLAGYLALSLGLVLFLGIADAATGLVILLWIAGAAVLAAHGTRRGIAGSGVAVAAFGALAGLLLVDGTGFLDRSFFLGLVLLLLLFFVEHVRAYGRTRSEREQARLRAARLELELVKRHIQPHFLLNTLTTLNELIETDPPRATAMIDALGEEFRMLTELSERDAIALDEEIALCRAHLAVMQLRYGARLTLSVEGQTGGIRLPPAVLHTLLENALTHNRYAGGEAEFTLTVERNDKQAALTLTTPLGEAAARGPGAGTGLGYVKARLHEAYGRHCSLASERHDHAWITRLELPACAL